MNNLHHIRQTGLIDPDNLTQSIGMVGAGGIGSWTALGLLKMGVKDLTVYDFDVVEEPNLGSQLYTTSDIGTYKVEALQRRLEVLTGTLLKVDPLRFEGQEGVLHHDIIIGAVDNMATRSGLLDALVGLNKLLIDGRMAGNVIQIFTLKLDDPVAVEKYRATLFSDEEATPIPCSERAVVYNTLIMGGLITDLIAQNANGLVLPSEIEMDLTNFTLYKTRGGE